MTTRTHQLPEYEVYALRYATVDRPRSSNFIASDDHDSAMPMDYFVWLIRGNGRVILVDTGFNAQEAQARQRQWLRCPVASWSALGVTPQDIQDVIVTHLHYDHAGNFDLLPHATLHIQESEMHYVSGRSMQHRLLRHPYTVGHVVDVIRRLFDERVAMYVGDQPFAPGIELLHIGGHTQGLQAVRVHTARGWIVLGSDTSHYYANILQNAPFPLVWHVGQMLDGYRKALQHCDDGIAGFVPGHDPLVRKLYPGVDEASQIVALHRAPPSLAEDIRANAMT